VITPRRTSSSLTSLVTSVAGTVQRYLTGPLTR
jgi:hypothetical protein